MKSLYVTLVFFLIANANFAQKEKVTFANLEAPYYNVGKDSLAVNGYDVTEYFNNNALRGLAKYQYNYQGIIYYFLNEKNKSKFVKHPKKYLPQFGGYCAYGIGMNTDSNGNPPGKYPIDPKTFKIINNKLYLFYNNSGHNFLKVWESNEKANLEQAHKRWKRIHRGNK
ncbi:YHS domain-containing (seleno)protein [Psychroserpens luteolus]|uniref:YHS domain-containing (seleno)protein n=1 Tax=Psychroserpens luteolus TaxID=2855840 RepID=UPI001E4CB3E7|nr:YHS domain-containing (seleno)protein [Psychroserpens luteolus]MCD2259509.1 YHS domain-containing protein [Psychroserpens luteolus]